MLNLIAPLGVSRLTQDVLEEAHGWIVRTSKRHPDHDRDPDLASLLSSASKVCSPMAEALSGVTEGTALLRYLTFAGDVARGNSASQRMSFDDLSAVLSELGDLRRRAGYLVDQLAYEFRVVGNTTPVYCKEAS
jgi:hypothetical protein